MTEQSVTCAIVYRSDSCQQCDVMGMTTAWIDFVTIYTGPNKVHIGWQNAKEISLRTPLFGSSE